MNTNTPHLITALTGPLLALEKHILAHQMRIEAWFRQEWRHIAPPFYSSVDLRNAGFKLAPVDTNLFSAGFNNLNPDFMPLCIQAVQATIAEICPEVTRLLLIPENHTRNQFYFESLATLQHILLGAGFEVRIGSLNPEITQPTEFDLPSGKKILLEPLLREGNKVGVADYFPCCIVLNNDMSDGIPDILNHLEQTLLPPAQLGWVNRLKSEHFRYYEQVTEKFAREINLDPWLFNPLFDHCPQIDFSNEASVLELKNTAEALFEKIQKKYTQYDIPSKPFLVIKADQGTYGMAVMMIKSPEELTQLNRKQRTRMSTLKGGASVTKVIIQEGVPTLETMPDGAVAEPVVYMIGRHVVGGFYRVHENRGIDENLNAPGMDFQPLAFAKPCHGLENNRFYAYGVVARLALLAAAEELRAFQ